jgi:hypothetical protein
MRLAHHNLVERDENYENLPLVWALNTAIVLQELSDPARSQKYTLKKLTEIGLLKISKPFFLE